LTPPLTGVAAYPVWKDIVVQSARLGLSYKFWAIDAAHSADIPRLQNVVLPRPGPCAARVLPRGGPQNAAISFSRAAFFPAASSATASREANSAQQEL
jgi:hypothetical protein